MRAAVMKAFGEPGELHIAEVQDPVAGPGEVLIAVHAIGLNPADAYQVRGAFQIPPPAFPFSPGFEVAGVVAAIGGGVVGLGPGDRVLATTVYGAYAERLVVPSNSVAKVPDGVTLAQAAALPVAWGTAGVALHDRAAVQKGETVAVLGGAGAVGSAAIALARRAGAHVFASASNPRALQVQPDAVFSHRTGDVADQLLTLTEHRGVDIVIDMVGGHAGADALRALAWSGRLVVVGAASGELRPVEPFDLLTGNKGVLGVDFSTYIQRSPDRVAALTGEVMAAGAAGELRLQTPETVPIERSGEALAEVARFARPKTVLITPAGFGT